MLTPQLEIQLIAVVTAVACALPGVFLVLRRMALMSDAITHAVLLGIVLAFFVVHDVTSPALMAAAAATGVATVLLVELLSRTRLVREDAAIGLVFPALFSLAVILISRYAGDTHLDTDAVLLGELAFAPFERFEALGYDLGPQALWVMGSILLLGALFVGLFYKELKLATFDAALAASLGFSPALVHYGLMTLVSITAVGAFDAVGSVLVVALMIAPPAAAYLLTDRLAHMIGLSALIGAASALAGYWLASALDASIAGAMATMAGAAFGLAWLLAPEHGLLALALRRWRQRREFAEVMLAVHLLNHERTPAATEESRVAHLGEHLRWAPAQAAQVVRRAERRGLVRQQGEQLALTERGRRLARETLGDSG
ncbi:MAG TPA: metal ABC transporter permease [Roseiflexaceae bacterium]|nr:metal ABC transporter permease [Roseiflexaceae bacterium]